MLKKPSAKISHLFSGITIFDKLNLLVVLVFFIWALLFPIAYINPLGNEGESHIMTLIGIQYRKTSLLVLLLLVMVAGMSMNSKFKAWFLQYTGTNNDIYARLLHKGIIFVILIFFGEVVLFLRETLTQTLNIGRGYYFLGGLLIVGLIIDFLFLQRQYKLNKTYQHTQTTITQEESTHHANHTGFKNLFDE